MMDNCETIQTEKEYLNISNQHDYDEYEKQ